MWGTAALLLPLLAIISLPPFALLSHVLVPIVLPSVALVWNGDLCSANVECSRDLPLALRRGCHNPIFTPGIFSGVGTQNKAARTKPG